MTHISRDDVLKLAKLSALQLNDDEADALTGDLDRILSYVRQLDELHIENVEPAYQVTGLTNVMRDDTVRQDAVPREKLLALAPDTHENQIKVPKVL